MNIFAGALSSHVRPCFIDGPDDIEPTHNHGVALLHGRARSGGLQDFDGLNLMKLGALIALAPLAEDAFDPAALRRDERALGDGAAALLPLAGGPGGDRSHRSIGGEDRPA